MKAQYIMGKIISSLKDTSFLPPRYTLSIKHGAIPRVWLESRYAIAAPTEGHHISMNVHRSRFSTLPRFILILRIYRKYGVR